MKGKLVILVNQEEREYILDGPPMGYSVDMNLNTVRVWDSANTWLVNLDRLVELKVPNACLKR
jgi:hypothetical protein